MSLVTLHNRITIAYSLNITKNYRIRKSVVLFGLI